MKTFNSISVAVGVVGGFFVQYLGGLDKFLQGLFCMMILDWVAGLIGAMYNKKLSSQIGYKGILRKIMMLVVVATAVVVRSVIETDIPVREIVIVFYLANEGISILENASQFLPIPAKVKELLLQLRSQGEGEKANVV
jgi:toxin secretion/phage lysis holin